MTRYNTGNPLGSTDPRDLYDNAENLDAGINGTSGIWKDRFGRDRKSYAGIEADFQNFLEEGSIQTFQTYADAVAAGVPVNTPVRVFGDTGTHADPVTGQVVSNSGTFLMTASGLTWLASNVELSANLLPDSFNESIGAYGWRWGGRNWFSSSPTFASSPNLSSTTPVLTNPTEIARFFFAEDVPAVVGTTLRVRGRVWTGSSGGGFAVSFLNSSGTVIGSERSVSLAASGEQYPDVSIPVPAGWVRLRIRVVNSANTGVEMAALAASVGGRPEFVRVRMSSQLEASASATPNVAPDPYMKALRSPVGVRDTFFGTWVQSSPNSPYGGGAIQASGTGQCIRRLDLASMGIQVGDVISMLASIYKTSDDVSLNMQFRNASNAVVGSTSSFGNLGAGTGVFTRALYGTVPADAVVVDVYTVGVSAVARQLVAVAICRGYGLPSIAESALPFDYFRSQVSSVNILSDPWLQSLDKPLGNYSRYFGTWSNPGPNSPSGRGSIYGTGQVIRRCDLEPMGLIPGDAITVRTQLYKDAGTVNLLVQFRNASNTVISTVDYGSIGASAGIYDISVFGTIPAACAYIDINLNVTASLYRELTATAIGKGAKLPEFEHAPVPLSAIASGDLDVSSTPVYGQAFLTRTRRKLASLSLDATGNPIDSAVLSIGLIGDSWTQQARRWPRPLADLMASQYGDGGPGWYGFLWDGETANRPMGNARSDYSGTGGGIVFRTGYTISRTGTWADIDETSPSPDLGQVNSSTAGSRYDLAWPGPVATSKVSLFYVGTATPGSVRYSWDAGSTWTTLALAGADGDLIIADLSGYPATGPATLRVEVVSGSVSICGIDVRGPTDKGVRVNKLGNLGAMASDFLSVDAAKWQSGIAALNLDVVTLMLGTNDQFAGITASNFATQIGQIVSRIKAAIPLCEIVLVTPFENQRTNSIPMNDYAKALRSYAISNRITHVNLQPFFGASSSSYTDLMEDTTHPNDAGGRVMFDVIFKALASK